MVHTSQIWAYIWKFGPYCKEEQKYLDLLLDSTLKQHIIIGSVNSAQFFLLMPFQGSGP